jgi:hypothetical protein
MKTASINWLMVAASLVGAGIESSCGSDQPRIERGACAGDEACRLTLVDEREIATTGLNTTRPDIAKTLKGAYLGVTAMDPTQQAFDLLALNSDLTSLVSTKTLASNATDKGEVTMAGTPSDMRIVSNGEDTIWCAFESFYTATDPPMCKNCLNFAAFSDDSGSLTLAKGGEVECVESSCPVSGKMPTFPKGSIMTNDPLPFFFDGKYYIVLHQYGASGLGISPDPYLPVRVFDSSFAQLPSFTIDLSELIGSWLPGTFSLVDIAGNPWLIGSIFNGPPCRLAETTGESDLVAVQLSVDLKSTVGGMLTLSATSAYANYVPGARYADGKLYITHNIEAFECSPTRDALKVFDVTNGFALLDDISIHTSTANENGVLYNHSTVELIDGKVYVIFPRPPKLPSNTIGVQVFEWRDAG